MFVHLADRLGIAGDILILVGVLQVPLLDRRRVVAQLQGGVFAPKLIGNVVAGRFFDRFVEGSLGLALFLVRAGRNGDLVNFPARVRLRADPTRASWWN